MKLLIDSSNRFNHKVSLLDNLQREVVFLESTNDLLKMIDDVLNKEKIRGSNLSAVSARLEGESRVGIMIGVSAANALNYLLGLKKVVDLEFPDDNNGFPI